VVTITLGYATTYVAGFIGVIYIIGGVITPAFSEKDRQRLYSMMYGTTCFAIFFSFIGTVLGGLWADDSWGRFWGWDPKENGALIIVIWNALVLHARWGGMIRARGMAILSVLGNIVVSWSFFGVNELGVGLHAYGLTEGRMFMLAMFALSQLAIAAVGLIPERAWWSFQAHADSPTREPEELDSMV
jgi:ABC-type transport system involved in cytochrome c biogenesis permease subunit